VLQPAARLPVHQAAGGRTSVQSRSLGRPQLALDCLVAHRPRHRTAWTSGRDEPVAPRLAVTRHVDARAAHPDEAPDAGGPHGRDQVGCDLPVQRAVTRARAQRRRDGVGAADQLLDGTTVAGVALDPSARTTRSPAAPSG
jgi:hypothetical protein